MEDIPRFLPRKTVEDAHERGYITRQDMELYLSISRRAKLSEKQIKNINRINKLIPKS